MASDTMKELRKLAKDELVEREQELRTQLFKLRTGEVTEKVKDSSQFRKVKKDIARILTIRTEQEAENSPKAQA